MQLDALNRPSRCREGYRVALAFFLAGCAFSLFSPATNAQIGPGGVPNPVYFNTLAVYHDGDYRAALNGFLNEGARAFRLPRVSGSTRSAITRWRASPTTSLDSPSTRSRVTTRRCSYS